MAFTASAGGSGTKKLTTSSPSNPVNTVGVSVKPAGSTSTYNNAAKIAADNAAWEAAKEEERRQERVKEQSSKSKSSSSSSNKVSGVANALPGATTGNILNTGITPVNTITYSGSSSFSNSTKVAAEQAAAQEAARQAEAQRQEQLAARKRAEEQERQRQAQIAEQQRLAAEEAARQAEIARQEQIRQQQAEAKQAVERANTTTTTSAGYMPYGDPRQKNEETTAAPQSQEEWLQTPEGQAALANERAKQANEDLLTAAAQANNPVNYLRDATPGNQRYDARYPRTTPAATPTTTSLTGARYAEDYPEYTGEQPTLYGQRTANADYYRGRELMQPVYTTAQQNRENIKVGQKITANRADEDEFYNGTNPFMNGLEWIANRGAKPVSGNFEPNGGGHDRRNAIAPAGFTNGIIPAYTGNTPDGTYDPERYNLYISMGYTPEQALNTARQDYADKVAREGSIEYFGDTPYTPYDLPPQPKTSAVDSALQKVGNAIKNAYESPIGLVLNGFDPSKTWEENAESKLRSGTAIGRIAKEIGNILVPATNSGTIGANMSPSDIWNTIYENAKRNGESDASAKVTADEGTQQWLDYDATVGNEKYFTGEGTSTTGSTTKPGTNIPDSYSDLRTEAGRRAKDMGLENGTEEYKEFVNDYMNTHTYVGDPRTGVKYDSNDNPFYNTGGSTGNTSNSKATDKENRDALANADNPTATFIRERNAFEEQYKDSDKYKTDAERRAAAEQAAYDKIYDDYVAKHKDAIGEQDARSQAYQKIYDIGYRPDFNDPNKAYLKYITGMTDNENHMNATEKAIKNDYWTNEASDPLREFNMIAGHFDRSDAEDRLFYDITSELAGNAFANQYEWTGKNANDKNGKYVERKTPGTYATTPGFEDKADWVDTDINNPLNQNSALQAGLGGLLSADQLLHFYDANYSDLVIPPETQRWLASDSTHAIQELVLNGGKNLDRLQKEHGTKDEFNEALRALIEANPGLKMLVDNNKVSTSQVENNFFKAIIDDNGNVTNPFTSGNGTSNSPHPGYYEWNGQLYPIDQEKAKYYLKYGTYKGWDEGMRDYYNTFGTFYGYRPDWRTAGGKNTWKNNTGTSGSKSYSKRSYSNSGSSSGGGNSGYQSYPSNYLSPTYSGANGGYSYPYYANNGDYGYNQGSNTVTPSTSNKRESHVYNIMKNWSF